MTPQDLMTIIGVNVALFSVAIAIVIWQVSKMDTDIKSVGSDVKALSSRMDGHATRIDQLYRMFVDLLKERK